MVGKHRRLWRLLAVLLAFSLVAAACGGDDDDAADDGNTEATDDSGSSDDGGASDDGASDDGASDDGASDDVLASVSLEPDIAERRLSDVSGGERYRLAVAIALARRPPLLVLDAPTATLDTRSTRALLRALDRFPGAIVVLSADLSLAVEACHRVVILDDGHIAARGTPAELLTDAELLRWHGLQMPSGMSPTA